MPTQVERNRASKLRLRMKAGQTLLPEETAWLDEYEQGQHTRIATRSKKLIHHEESEEVAAAEGINPMQMAMAAAMTREEGMRLDMILKLALNAMRTAVELNQKLAEQCLRDKQADGETQRALLESVRTHYLERVDMEAQLRETIAEAEQKEGGVEALIQQFMPVILAELGKRAVGQKVGK